MVSHNKRLWRLERASKQQAETMTDTEAEEKSKERENNNLRGTVVAAAAVSFFCVWGQRLCPSVEKDKKVTGNIR